MNLVEILNQQPNGIAEFTIQEGRYLFVNGKERFFRGLSHSQMQAATVFDLFSENDKDSAIAFSKRLKDSIERLKIPHKNNSASPYVTVSMGLFCRQNNELTDLNHFSIESDKLLYQAKKRGRNKLVSI